MKTYVKLVGSYPINGIEPEVSLTANRSGVNVIVSYTLDPGFMGLLGDPCESWLVTWDEIESGMRPESVAREIACRLSGYSR